MKIAKKCILTLSIVLLLMRASLSELNAAPGDTILLFHPTVSNIHMIISLTENGVLPLGEVHFTGVYHEKEQYDYMRSSSYISNNQVRGFSLFRVPDNFDAAEIFQSHSSTEIFRRLFNQSKGAIFPGGPDIPPGTYMEPMNLHTRVTDPWRHYLELSFAFHLLGGARDHEFAAFMSDDPEYAILGICLGMQTINVATGGSLIQDIPSEVYGFHERESILSGSRDLVHRNYFFDDPSDTIQLTGYHLHPIRPRDEGPLTDLSAMESFPLVLSSHHQAIETTGEGLIIAATSMDGKIIEAVCHETYPSVIAVQFHPEKTAIYEPTERNYVNADSIISFNEYLEQTGSMLFHRAFWEYVAMLFSRQSE